MFLAFREMRRAKVRFGLLIAAVSLLVFLILVQQAIQNSLITSFIGAIERQTAPVLVYTTDAQRAPLGSVIPPNLEKTITDVDGVADSGRIGIGSFTVEVDPGAPTETEGGATESGATLFGFEQPDLGGPTTVSEGRLPSGSTEAVGSAADFAVGDQVRVLPTGTAQPVTITVVGVSENSQLLVTPTLFVGYPTYEAAVKAANPDAQQVLPSAIAIRPETGVSDAELVTRVNDASDQIEALTRQEAADGAPGVAQVKQSFQIIFGLYGLVVPLITGLFFLIITLQKAGSLTLLRAVGARAGVLVRSLLIQVLVVIGGGIALGTVLYAILTQFPLGTLSLVFDWSSVGFWAALLLGLGLLSALVSARRVLSIDPIQATTGGAER